MSYLFFFLLYDVLQVPPIMFKAHLKSLLEVLHHTLAHLPGDLTDLMSNIVLKLLNSLGSVDIHYIFQIPPEKEVWRV